MQQVLRDPGAPLDPGTRNLMEKRLGADFSQVRVHTDGAARASTAAVGAHAYTVGNHVVIGDGGTDNQTLAHELTHVIQQRRETDPKTLEKNVDLAAEPPQSQSR